MIEELTEPYHTRIMYTTNRNRHLSNSNNELEAHC